MADIFVPTNNLGFEAYFSEYQVEPVADDFLAEIRSVTGAGFSVETVEASSVTSKDGFKRIAPLNIEAKPMTVTLYKENSNFNRIYAKFMNNPTSSVNFYGNLALKYPHTSFNADVKDLVYSGFVSDLSLGDVEAGQLQTFSFVFTPTAKPVFLTGVLAYVPPVAP
jgi:hypothetical protein